MKTFTLLVTFLLSIFFSDARSQVQSPKATGGTLTFLGETQPIKSIAPFPFKERNDFERNEELKERNYPFASTALPKGADPVWQTKMGDEEMAKGAAVNFEGMENTGFPPDPNGDVGPNHYFQTVNTKYQIWDKAGNSIYGPADIRNIWGTTKGVSDPVVLYDENADRWFVSIFSTTPSGGPYDLYFAVSTSSDPTGTYYAYTLPGFSNKPDFTKFGIWRDGYYMSANRSGNDVFVFERDQMLIGSSTVHYFAFDNSWRPNSGFHCIMPVDNDGPFAPVGTPGMFITINDDAWGGSDELWLYELDVNWTTLTATFNRTQQLSVASFDSNFGPTWDNIAQQGTSQELDAVPQVLNFRAQYRNFGSYQAIVCNHSVDVDNTDHAGIRWYEVAKTSGSWFLYQQSTYAPDSHSRWMGAINLNSNGDIGLAYSISSTSMHPSLRFTGRKFTDPLNTMTFAEQSIIESSYSQTSGNRWGDYYSLSVDPSDGQTFWFTGEYRGSNIRTKIAAFSFNSYCAASGTSCGSSDEYISRVQFGEIDNQTDCDHYTDYSTTQINEIPINAAETITVTNGYPYSADQCGIWVDWNNDGDFDDAGESITVSGSTGVGPYTAVIDPPGSVSVGSKYTMRVRIVFNATPSPCETTYYGEVEDYGIEIGSFASNNTWTGAVSDDWFTAGNWSLGVIPTSDVSVTIPAGTPNDPVIGPGSAYCKNLYLNSGATLTQNEVSYFYCYGTFDAGFGQFTMNGTSYLYFAGSSDTYWWDDYQDDTYTNVRVYKSTSTASVTMKYDMVCSGTFEIREGVFKMDDSRTLTVTGTASGAFEVEDGGKLILDGTKTVDVAGGVKFYDGSQLQMTAGWIKTGGNLWVEANTLYDIHFNAGWLYMTGSGDQYIQDLDGGNLELFSVSIQKPSGTCYIANANLDINGSLFINSGTLSCRSASGSSTVYDIYIAGNWTNNVGTAGFDEATGRVIFNGGNYHQYCYTDETFNELEVAKTAGGAFRMDGTNVVCAAYDWTAGAVDVLSGSFTANDLLDNAIKGAFYNNAGGTINLTNSGSGTYVDLSGELHLFGGTMNVTGSVSWWPFAGDASIEMTGGVLDFTSCGITISSSSYTLNNNITGGVIRTAGGFSGQRADFTPAAGTFEFYGGADVYFSQSNGCTLYNVNIDKSTKESTNSTKIIPASGDRTDKTIGDGKGNMVTLSTDIVITNDFDITSGALTIGSHTLAIDGDCNINGLMDVGATGIVQNHGLFELGTAGTLNITGGSFVNDHPYGTKAWQDMNGTLNLSAGLFEMTHNSIRLTSTFVDNITGGIMRTGMSFRALTAGTFEPTGGTVEFTGAGNSNPLIDCTTGNYFHNVNINSPFYYVLYTNTEVRGNLTIDNGLLDFYSYDLSCLGNVYINNGGSMSIGNNSALKLDDGSALTVAAGGEIQIVGSVGNEATVSHISSGTYNFSVFGTIGAEYAVFEYMNGSSINVKSSGTVDVSHSFNNCIFRNGAPAPSALLTLNNDQTLTCNNVYFENASGNTGYNVWKYYDTGDVTFISASGDFAGPEFEYDPNNRVDWTDMDINVDITVMLEGPYNGTDMNTDLNTLGLIPLNQPFNTIPGADWYYTGTESVSSIPPNVVDWVLVQIRDAGNAASAGGGTVVAEQAAFLLNNGNIVDLDGSSNLSFPGITYSSGLFPVVWHRNHLGIISANKMTRTGGVYTYDFTQAGSAYNNTNAGEVDLGGGVFGMFGGDSNGTGWVYDGDIYFDWNPFAGETGYRKADYNLDGQLDNKDKNDVWFDSYNTYSQIPGSKGNFDKDNE